MKQILQSLNTGTTEIVEVPCPRVKPGHLLIRTSTSLVSAGTERMLVEFGKANLLDKARQQPEKVRMVLDKVNTDGLIPTLEAVRSKLDQPLPMGYSNAGIVLAAGAGVGGFAPGDRVVSNGPHAEVVCVPKNLCAKIPDSVSDEAAAFTVLGAIALQGIRLAQPTLGETFAVTGLGLIGLIAVQLLRAQGCRVLGIDFDPKKLDLARQFGAETADLSRGEDPVAAACAFSRGRGVDGVLIAASTKSNEPVHQAAQMCRKRGRIVLVGVVGLELSRADFYEKELSFQVSCSYGPGRYDPAYEQAGQDYPLGFVRWTAQRNFEAVLDTLATGSLDIAPLISHRFPLDRAVAAYELLSGREPSLGILLQCPDTQQKPSAELLHSTIQLTPPVPPGPNPATPVIGFIGAGNYATRILIPAFQQTGTRLKAVATSGGVSGVYAGQKFGFQLATTDTASLLADPEINTLVIATRHDSHAQFVCQALQAGKHVFVEKPLAITPEQLDEIKSARASALSAGSSPVLAVGFNRRFAPQIGKIKALLASLKEPKAMVMTVNAGAIPPDNWIQDPTAGGGRIIGEACHFIDLLRFLADSPIVSVQTTAMGAASGVAIRDDKVSFTLSFADGSFGTVHYLANGHKSFPKERLEIFCAGRILELDNFRKLQGYGWPGFKTMNLWRQDKGNNACAAAFISAIQSGQPAPIPFEELIEVTRTSFQIAEDAQN
ncbi:MAG: bi-domain-containing oxidoreductase [Oscillatoria princeps RMCB-10]|jgi:predicted dehydrogenase/threonine dehydrogenase-like Zn-dependent dehydrogenase|nr:bi-domain-containing oxidoreductase [Oscillatoria princeps RMCB-10]